MSKPNRNYIFNIRYKKYLRIIIHGITLHFVSITSIIIYYNIFYKKYNTIKTKKIKKKLHSISFYQNLRHNVMPLEFHNWLFNEKREIKIHRV